MPPAPAPAAARAESAERRAHPRETPPWLALIFFDSGNWGRLINLSESGMAFEFAQPPDPRQVSTFVLETISTQPSQPAGDPRVVSIQADGQVIWVQDSEKTAGVLFADKSGRAREQIKQWLSLGPLPIAPKRSDDALLAPSAVELQTQLRPEPGPQPPVEAQLSSDVPNELVTSAPEPPSAPATAPNGAFPEIVSAPSVAPSDAAPALPPIELPATVPLSEQEPLTSDAASFAQESPVPPPPFEPTSPEPSFPLLSGSMALPQQTPPAPKSVPFEPYRVLPGVDLEWLRTESPSVSEANGSESPQLPFDPLPTPEAAPQANETSPPPALETSPDPMPPPEPVAQVEPAAQAPPNNHPAPVAEPALGKASATQRSDQPAARAPLPRQSKPLPSRPAKLRAPAPALPPSPSTRPTRISVLSLVAYFAALAVLAAAAFAWPQHNRLPSFFAGIRDSFFGGFAPSNSPRLAPPAPLAPFQVEVLDASNKRWLLTFDHSAAPAASTPSTAPAQSIAVASAASAPKNPPQAPPDTSAKRPLTPAFKLAGPTLARPSQPVQSPLQAEDVPPPINPGTPIRAGASSGDALPGVLSNSAKLAPAAPETPPPTPPEKATKAGGQVQLPRLLSSVAPVYPPMASAMRLQGEVTVDALIDASGKVSGVKALSGPLILRQAALDSVRQWRYDPARLDGQPTSIHLQVTVRFRVK
ncbi:MAG TPA: TonB family protein [Candidatus Acidoferrales bacterium]|nr:TonB family protein [Candidatus Acidoferrales bacterium]